MPKSRSEGRTSVPSLKTEALTFVQEVSFLAITFASILPTLVAVKRFMSLPAVSGHLRAVLSASTTVPAAFGAPSEIHTLSMSM